jgi:hypothetical protein
MGIGIKDFCKANLNKNGQPLKRQEVERYIKEGRIKAEKISGVWVILGPKIGGQKKPKPLKSGRPKGSKDKVPRITKQKSPQSID